MRVRLTPTPALPACRFVTGPFQDRGLRGDEGVTAGPPSCPGSESPVDALPKPLLLILKVEQGAYRILLELRSRATVLL